MDRTAVLITHAIAVGVSEDNRRRLAVQGEVSNGSTNGRLLNPSGSPPMTGNIGLVGHRSRDGVDDTSEGALTDRAVTDLLP